MIQEDVVKALWAKAPNWLRICCAGAAGLLVAAVFIVGEARGADDAVVRYQLSTIDSCAKYHDHTYEVCVAYVVNSTALALVPYYKWANSPNGARAVAATNRFRSRYFGAARQKIALRVDRWVAGENNVSIPRISILQANSNLETNSATLRTQETWKVRSKKRGRIIYREVNKLHTVYMRRIQGLILHKWVIVRIT